MSNMTIIAIAGFMLSVVCISNFHETNKLKQRMEVLELKYEAIK